MAGSVNKVILVGHLGRDPEVRTSANGNKAAYLRMATSETWRDRETGERKERTEWHSIAIYNENLAKVAEQYLRKGSSVYIEGALETRKWQDREGRDRYTTEIVLRAFRGELTLLGGPRNEGSPQDDYGQSSGGYGNQSAGGSAYGASTGGAGGFDDDIPYAPQVL